MSAARNVRCGCQVQATKVVDSRPTDKFGPGVRRRVECLHCGHRWTTFEMDETAVIELQSPRVQTLIGHVERFLELLKQRTSVE